MFFNPRYLLILLFCLSISCTKESIGEIPPTTEGPIIDSVRNNDLVGSWKYLLWTNNDWSPQPVDFLESEVIWEFTNEGKVRITVDQNLEFGPFLPAERHISGVKDITFSYQLITEDHILFNNKEKFPFRVGENTLTLFYPSTNSTRGYLVRN